MKKLHLLKTILLLCALIAGSNCVWATDVVYYTLTTASTGGNTSPHNDYTAAATTTVSKMEWSVTGNSNQSPWRIGGKSITNQDRTVFSKTAMGSAITKLEIVIGAASSITINSVKLVVSSAQDGGGTKIDEVNKTSGLGANKTLEFNPTSPLTEWTTGSYYKFIFNVTVSGTTNRFLELNSIKFYQHSDIAAVATPTFSPIGGTYKVAQTVTISCETADAVVHYTTNGDDPTESDAVYSSPISITKSGTVLKAKAFKDAMLDSEIASATYVIRPDAPTFSLDEGLVSEGASLTISQAAGVSIYYTTDGSTPTGTSTEYSSPLVINYPMIIKAIAIDSNGNPSNVSSTSYRIFYADAIEIVPSYSFYGKAATFSGTTNDEVTGSQDGVTFTYTRNGANLYANASSMRFYGKNTLKIDAPVGKVITKVVFVKDASGSAVDDITSAPSGYAVVASTWTGIASSITFERPNTSGYLQFSYIYVFLANTISLNAACNDGAKYYGTFSSSSPFVVPSDLTVSAIKVVDHKMTLMSYETGDIVPADEGVLVTSTISGDHYVNLSSSAGTSKDGNLLQPTGDTGKTAGDMSDTDYYYYRLTMVESKPGFWWKSEDGAGFAIDANKAYLKVLKTAAARGFGFDDEATGINNLRIKSEVRSEYFNLAGQRVTQPTKGLYVVDGKKIVIK